MREVRNWIEPKIPLPGLASRGIRQRLGGITKGGDARRILAPRRAHVKT